MTPDSQSAETGGGFAESEGPALSLLNVAGERSSLYIS